MSESRRPIRRVLAADRASDEILEAVRRHRPSLEARQVSWRQVTNEDLSWADVYVGFKLPPAADVAPLAWIHCTGAGVDGLIEGRAWPPGLLLTRTPGTLGQRMAEYCLGHILARTQRLAFYRDAQRRKRWESEGPETLAAKVVGFLGTGEMARPAARLLQQLGARTIGFNRTGDPIEGFHQVIVWEERDSSDLSRLDWLIIALPGGEATTGILRKKDLLSLYGAGLINIGRGNAVEEGHLIKALSSEAISCAILDVFEEEPLTPRSPLWEHNRVTITPHIAGPTDPREVADLFLRNLEAWEQEAPLLFQVDVQRGY